MFGPVEHPWLDPLWARLLLVSACAGWTCVEYFFGSVTWVYIMGAITLYAGWAYLISYQGPDVPDRKTRPRMSEDDT
ncbi:hypothetical protein [Roseibium denhamense]|uniref:DUF3329 domain-containing protein n=1 Tax=Roseibium denhamense TaxID=76305 RepID=A0ABY1P3Y8_9HYPH|nr:hypothetical protein [Roseibium denhamense]SMP25899.1 hypothetical protein SAMN06265374_2649 [Roseibium denhamense]